MSRGWVIRARKLLITVLAGTVSGGIFPSAGAAGSLNQPNQSPPPSVTNRPPLLHDAMPAELDRLFSEACAEGTTLRREQCDQLRTDLRALGATNRDVRSFNPAKVPFLVLTASPEALALLDGAISNDGEWLPLPNSYQTLENLTAIHEQTWGSVFLTQDVLERVANAISERLTYRTKLEMALKAAWLESQMRGWGPLYHMAGQTYTHHRASTCPNYGIFHGYACAVRLEWGQPGLWMRRQWLDPIGVVIEEDHIERLPGGSLKVIRLNATGREEYAIADVTPTGFVDRGVIYTYYSHEISPTGELTVSMSGRGEEIRSHLSVITHRHLAGQTEHNRELMRADQARQARDERWRANERLMGNLYAGLTEANRVAAQRGRRIAATYERNLAAAVRQAEAERAARSGTATIAGDSLGADGTPSQASSTEAFQSQQQEATRASGWCYATRNFDTDPHAWFSRIGYTDRYMNGVTTDHPNVSWQNRMEDEFRGQVPSGTIIQCTVNRLEPREHLLNDLRNDGRTTIIDVNWAPH